MVLTKVPHLKSKQAIQRQHITGEHLLLACFVFGGWFLERQEGRKIIFRSMALGW